MVLGITPDARLHGRIEVCEINPMASARYWDPYATSGANSVPGAIPKMLADLVRTDRHGHRPIAGSSDEANAVDLVLPERDLGAASTNAMHRLRCWHYPWSGP